jgi:hypothetical protein
MATTMIIIKIRGNLNPRFLGDKHLHSEGEIGRREGRTETEKD